MGCYKDLEYFTTQTSTFMGDSVCFVYLVFRLTLETNI